MKRGKNEGDGRSGENKRAARSYRYSFQFFDTVKLGFHKGQTVGVMDGNGSVLFRFGGRVFPQVSVRKLGEIRSWDDAVVIAKNTR